jgi:hypothetical protein
LIAFIFEFFAHRDRKNKSVTEISRAVLLLLEYYAGFWTVQWLCLKSTIIFDQIHLFEIMGVLMVRRKP